MTNGKVLVVDDDPMVRSMLERMLGKEGIEVVTARDGQHALDMFWSEQPDVVLLDVVMPTLDGFEVCRRLKEDPESRLTPVVMITGLGDVDDRVRSLELGADDFLSKPVQRVELIARVRSLVRSKHYTDELERAETVLMTLARSVESRDPNTGDHCERLSRLSGALGERMGLGDEEITALRRGGVVHDIGKVLIPDAILLKQGPLAPDERAIMQQHPVEGEHICKPLKSMGLVTPIIRHHHEKRDGSGYPDGLGGDEIPLTARVLQVVDVYDALTTQRPYKPAISPAKTLEMMREEVDMGWGDADVFAEFRQMVIDGQNGKGVPPCAEAIEGEAGRIAAAGTEPQ